MSPCIIAACRPAIRYNPDMPLFGIDRARCQTEGIISRIVLKSSVIIKFLTVNNKMFPQPRCGFNRSLSLVNQPVYHLHQLIPSVFTWLCRIDSLLGTDYQCHGIRTITGAMIQSPFIYTRGYCGNILV